MSISSDNRRIVTSSGESYSNVWMASFEKNPRMRIVDPKQITKGTAPIFGATISPDGNRIAFSRQGRIFVLPVDREQELQLTFGSSFNPVWSPDGMKIAYLSYQNGKTRVWDVVASGGTPHVFKGTELSGNGNLAWSPGSHILYQKPGNRNFGCLDPLTELERPLVRNDSAGFLFSPQYSPDKRNIAVFWNRNQRGIWLLATDDTVQRFLLPSIPSLVPMAWSLDNRLLYVYGSPQETRNFGKIIAIRISDGKIEESVALPFHRVTRIEMNPTMMKLLFIVSESKTDAWMLENFDPEVE